MRFASLQRAVAPSSQLDAALQRAGYEPDPHVHLFTGWVVEPIERTSPRFRGIFSRTAVETVFLSSTGLRPLYAPSEPSPRATDAGSTSTMSGARPCRPRRDSGARKRPQATQA